MCTQEESNDLYTLSMDVKQSTNDNQLQNENL